MQVDEMELRSADISDVEDAAERLRDVGVITPVLESARLNEMVGGRVLLKAEVLQRTGSYKFRGAYNRLCRLNESERERGVVAFSTGNFGQAVAMAAELLSIPATVVLPKDAPAIKVENARGYGADVLFYDRDIPNHREKIAAELSERKGLTVIRPGDDTYVIAGYGTCGLELFAQVKDPIDAVLCPCGGGGLMAGIIAASDYRTHIEMYTVEPEHFDDTSRSLKLGRRVGNEIGRRSLCDAILTPMPAELPFRTLVDRVRQGLVVKDEETERAMEFAFRELKLVLEPAGAIALAAAMAGKVDCRGRTTAVICSGGSVDPEIFARVIRQVK